MDMVQFLLFIALLIAVFVLVDRIAAIWWPNEDRREMDEWQKLRRILEVPGESVPGESSSFLNDRTGVTWTEATGAGARPRSRTLRGDITQLWERCKRITRTRF